MAGLFTLSLDGSFYNILATAQAEGLSCEAVQFAVSGLPFSKGTLLVGTSNTAIPMAQIATPHWAIFHNLDTVKTIQIAIGNNTSWFCKLLQSEWFCGPLDPSVTAPFAKASASCYLEYLILSL